MKIYQIKVYDADAMNVSTHLTTLNIRRRKEGEEKRRTIDIRPYLLIRRTYSFGCDDVR